MEATSTIISVIDLINLSKDLAQLNLNYLGICVAILAVLGGGFIYFNINPLKEGLDKQEITINKIKDETEKISEETIKQTKESLEIFKKEQNSELNLTIKENNDKLKLEINNNISETEKDLNEKIDTVSEDKDKKLKELITSETNNTLNSLEKSLGIEIKNTKEEFEKKLTSAIKEIESLKNNIKEANRDITKLKVYKFKKEGKMGSVIYSIKLLKEAIDEKSWEIPSNLEELKEEITGVSLNADYITDIEEQLNRITEEKKYDVLVKEIREKYIRKEIK